jgi:hypothetical protein
MTTFTSCAYCAIDLASGEAETVICAETGRLLTVCVDRQSCWNTQVAVDSDICGCLSGACDYCTPGALL